jgi:hypothetical protein
MKNLLERLKPEIALAIDIEYAEYPSLKEDMINILNDTQFLTNLKYTYILDLERLYRKAFGDFPNKVWDCLIENKD